MPSTVIQSPAGVNHQSYIQDVDQEEGLLGGLLTGLSLITNLPGDDTITINLGNGRALRLYGEFTGLTFLIGVGTVTSYEFLLNGEVQSVTSGTNFSLAQLRVAMEAGEAAVEALLKPGAMTYTGHVGNDVLVGGAFADQLSGGDGNDTLEGGAGNDTFYGGAGADHFVGGAGNDVYVNPDALDDFVEEAGKGTDLVQSNATFSLSRLANLENLELTGSANIDGTGNSLRNYITGNSGHNTLTGGSGADTLDGGVGHDTLIGGVGNDVYYRPTNDDTIVEGVNRGIDTVLTDTSFTLDGIANVENIQFFGTAEVSGEGNALGNRITGNDAANILRGLGGNDMLVGNAGHDTMDAGAGADTLLGGRGSDRMTVGGDADQDVIAYDGAIESTGIKRDTIIGLDLANEDRIDLPNVPVWVMAPLGGTLNSGNFDNDLAAALSSLEAGAAVLFDPTGGNLNKPGVAFIVVDANDVTGYQAGEDYVIQIQNYSGTLTQDDFI